MRPSRKQFAATIAGLYATIGSTRFPAGAAEFSYKLSHGEEKSHPLSIRAQEAADAVLKDSGGRLEIKVFPFASLGTDSATLVQLRANALEFVLLGDNILATVVPSAGISSVPFAFATHAEAWKALDGDAPLGSYVRRIIAGANMYAFAKRWEVGFRQLWTTPRAVVSPNDVKGLKIRVPNAPVSVALFRALGGTPTPINGAEMYTALQTKLVDGVDDAMPGFEAFKLFEVTKFGSITNHAWTGYNMLAAPEAWLKLPKNLRDLTEKNFNDAAVRERNDVQRLELSLQTTLKGQGITFSQPDIPAFRTVVRNAGLYAQWRDLFGKDAWALLEKETKITT